MTGGAAVLKSSTETEFEISAPCLLCFFECQHAVLPMSAALSIWRRGRTEVRRIGFQEGLHSGWSLLHRTFVPLLVSFPETVDAGGVAQPDLMAIR